MHTVMRFVGNGSEDDVNLRACGAMLNDIIPGLYEGINLVREHGFSCSLCMANDWPSHHQSIMEICTNLRPLLDTAKRAGLHVEIDCAIHYEDHCRVPVNSLGCQPELLRILADCNTWLVISIYGGGME